MILAVDCSCCRKFISISYVKYFKMFFHQLQTYTFHLYKINEWQIIFFLFFFFINNVHIIFIPILSLSKCYCSRWVHFYIIAQHYWSYSSPHSMKKKTYNFSSTFILSGEIKLAKRSLFSIFFFELFYLPLLLSHSRLAYTAKYTF